MSLTRTRSVEKPLEELSDRALKQQVRRAEQTLRVIDAADAAELARLRKTDEYIARGEQAVETVETARAELKRRATLSTIERMPLVRQLRDSTRREHPATKALRSVTRFSHRELIGERLDAARLNPEEASELDALVTRRLKVAFEEKVEPLTDQETAAYERLVGKAAGNSMMFEQKREARQAKMKLEELKEEGRVAALPRRPQLAEPGSVELPRLIFLWLKTATDGNWSIMDVGALSALLLAFENADASIVAGGRFEAHDDDLVLIVPGGVGSDLRFARQLGGSPFDDGGFIRLRPALVTLARNEWLVVEQSVAELRVRLGPRALELKKAKTATS
jgi:hypothetical protein